MSISEVAVPSSPTTIKTAESNSKIIIEKLLEPKWIDIVDHALCQIYEVTVWPYKTTWEVVNSIVFVFFAPLKITKLFYHSVIVSLQLFTQSMQSFAEATREKNASRNLLTRAIMAHHQDAH